MTLKQLVTFFCLVNVFFQGVLAQQIGTDANAPMIQNEDTEQNTPKIGGLHLYVDDIKRIQEAFNQSKPDSNIIIYRYDPQHTYKVRLRSFMTAVIQLPKWEQIYAFTLGDTHLFQFEVLDKKNVGVIKNKFAGADSNLTIIGTSGNIYNFYIRVDNVKSPFLPLNVVYIHAKQPESLQDKTLTKNQKPIKPTQESKKSPKTPKNVNDYLRDIDNATRRQLESRQDLDWRYVIYLNENMIPPTKVFDDGFWTYFKISKEDNLDKVEELPALFMVDSEGKEVPANLRVVKGYLIAEQIGRAWVLRQGEKYICIQKDTHNKERDLS